MKRILPIFIVFIFYLLTPKITEALSSENYAYEKFSLKNNYAPEDIKNALTTEVNNVITQTSRLQPYFQDVGILESFLYWGYPGEEFLVLSEALPYLDQTKQTEVKNYLKNQIGKYPPLTYAYFPNSWGTTDLNATPRREYYPLGVVGQNIWPAVPLPPAALYVVWKYADATGDWQYVSQNWTAIENFYNSYVGSNQSINSYQGLIATIGYVRMAAHQNQTAKITAALQRIDSAKSVLADTKSMITSLRNTHDVGSAHDWHVPLFTANRSNKAIVTLYGPELGRFLAMEPTTPVSELLKVVYEKSPQWYMFKSNYPGYGNADATGSEIWQGQEVSWLIGSGYGENNMMQPDTVWTLFLIKADVEKTQPDTLKKYLDAPYTKTGDLYYIHKLIKVAEAYSVNCWEDTRNGTQNCEELASPSPISCPADITGDRFIDLSDFGIIFANFGKSNPTNPKADINGDGIVDLSDFSVIYANFGKSCS